MGSKIFEIWGLRKFWPVGFKNGKIRGKKKKKKDAKGAVALLI